MGRHVLRRGGLAATVSTLAVDKTWNATCLLSRPVTSWPLTLISVESGERSKGTRTLTGDAVTAWLSATWDGKATERSYFPNGRFTWTLKATGLGSATRAGARTQLATGWGGYKSLS